MTRSRKTDKSKPEWVDDLTALLQDPTGGAAVLLVRQMLDLRADNARLKTQATRVWAVATLLTVGLIGVTWAAYTVFPKTRYIPTTDAEAICEVASQERPVATVASLQEFAKDAVVASYNYDYLHYRQQIDEALNRFYSNDGRKDFNRALDASGNLEKVLKQRLSLVTSSTNVPQLESEGLRGTQPYWVVQVPILVEFYQAGAPAPTGSTPYIASVTVVQEQASRVNVKGLAVDSVVLKPGRRR